MPAGPWDKFAPPEKAAGPWDKFATAAEAEPGVAEDVAKSSAIGLPKGVMKLVGLPGDVSSLIGQGVNAAGNWLTGRDQSSEEFAAKRAKMLGGGADIAAPGYAGIRGGVEKVTGPLYESKTIPGEYAQTVTEMIPAALAGPGGIARRIMQGAVVPGVTSEAAGQFTKGTEAEPYARMIGGVAPQLAAQGTRALLVAPRGGAARAADVANLEAEGVTSLSAGQKTGSRPLQYLEQSLGDITGAGTRMTERGAEQFTQAALKRAGINAPRATQEVVDDAFTRIGNQFDRLAANNTLHPDPAMGPQIRNEIAQYHGIVSPPNRAPVINDFEQEIAQALGANRGTLSGRTYASIRSRMEETARRAPHDVADTLRGMKNALDSAMERHLQRIGSSDLGAWQQVRREYKNILPIERAVTASGSETASGLISPTQLLSAVRNQNRRSLARGTGDLARLARSGEHAMRTLPQSGTAPRSYMSSLVGAGGLGAVGTGLATGNPLLLAGGVATVAGPPLAGRALMSRPVQRFFANPRPFNYSPVINTVPSLMQMLPRMQYGGRPTGPTIVGENGPEVFVPDQPGTIAPGPNGPMPSQEEIQRYLAATTQNYPKFGAGGIPINPAGVDAMLERAPESQNIEDRRDERGGFEAAAAKVRRRYPTRTPDPASLAASQGRAATWEQFLPSDQRALQAAGNLQRGGDYDPRDVFLSALGAVGAPAAGPAQGGATLGAGIVKPIRAYHGSPHDFERFDLSKIGTGEGAQAYGHGLYFAENPKTAKAYRDTLAEKQMLSNEGPVHYGEVFTNLQAAAEKQGLHPDQSYQLVKQVQDKLERGAPLDDISYPVKRFDDAYKAIADEAVRRGYKANPGRMYEVNINAAPEQFLDWDKALSQSGAAPTVGPIVDRLRGASGMIERKLGADPTGEQIYSALGSPFGRKAVTGTSEGFSSKAGSTDVLREAGIPGIKYLDQGSRQVSGGELIDVFKGPQGWQSKIRMNRPNGEQYFTTSAPHASEEAAKQWAEGKIGTPGTSNYVLFRDDIIDIVKKYGLAGAAAMVGISQDEARAAMGRARPREATP